MSVNTEIEAAKQENFSMEDAKKAFLNGRKESLTSKKIDKHTGANILATSLIKDFSSFREILVDPTSEGSRATGAHESGALVHIDTNRNSRRNTPPTILLELPSVLTIEALPDTLKSFVEPADVLPETENIVLPLERTNIYQSEDNKTTTVVYDFDQVKDDEPRTVGYVKLTTTDVEVGSTLIHQKEKVGIDKNGEVVGIKLETKLGHDKAPSMYQKLKRGPKGIYPEPDTDDDRDAQSPGTIRAPKLTFVGRQAFLDGRELSNHATQPGGGISHTEVFTAEKTNGYLKKQPSMSRQIVQREGIWKSVQIDDGRDAQSPGTIRAPKLTFEGKQAFLDGQPLSNYATPPGGGRESTK